MIIGFCCVRGLSALAADTPAFRPMLPPPSLAIYGEREVKAAKRLGGKVRSHTASCRPLCAQGAYVGGEFVT